MSAFVFFFKQKTAYEMRISDWSSDVCSSDLTGALLQRVRHRATDSSCGLCGIENLEQAIRPLPPVTAGSRADRTAVFRALAMLGDHQPLNAATGAAHAAAWAGADGAIRLVREDVGRHNAFDKLIGAMRRADAAWGGGLALRSEEPPSELQSLM